MSKMWTYLSGAVQGVERYFSTNKLAAVLFGVLLAAWLMKLAVNRKGNRLLVYTVIMCALLLFPVTAVIIMQYQTSFYDYEWAWGMVPVTVVIAYIFTVLLERIAEKKRQMVFAVSALIILILCGNQGTFQVVGKEDAAARKAVPKLVQCVEQAADTDQVVVWAPKDIMQELRRFDGKILLVYGRDMWDGKSGAYDYEAYSEEIIDAYEWLNTVLEEVKTAEDFADPLYVLEALSVENGTDVQAEASILAVIEKGANTIILPDLAAECYGNTVKEIAEQKAMDIEITYAEGYTIFLLQ